MSVTPGNYGFLRSVDDLAKLAKAVADEPHAPMTFDLETGYEGPDREGGSLAWHAGAFIVGFSFTIDPKWSRYVPLRHDYLDENLPGDDVWEIMRPLLEDRGVIAHNAKFERRGCRTVGIEMKVKADTMLQAHVLSDWRAFGQKFLVKEIFGHQQREIEDLFPKAKKKDLDALRFNILGLTPEVVAYACEDTAWGLALHLKNEPRVLADPKLAFIYRLELEVLDLMCDVEDHGVAVDWPTMERWWQQAIEFVRGLEDEVRADFGALLGRSLSAMNVKSPSQLAKVLFDPEPAGLGLPVTHWTDGGKSGVQKPATHEVALTKIAKQAPEEGPPVDRKAQIGAAVAKLLTAREIDNHRKRFELWLDVDTHKPPIRGTDGRVHAGYSQDRVATGRFSASNPPIQQCPKDWRFELTDGRVFEANFRDLIVASPGTYLIGFDYSQIELRAIAGLAQERALLEAFERGDDVHSLTAAMMLGKDLADIDRHTERPIGKTMNFALIYQMGVRSLAARLGISFEEAQRLYDSYFANMPAISAYIERSKDECKRRTPPHTRSYFGRKWTIWNLMESDASHAQYAAGERQAVNAPVQGWAADYMKIAMARVARFLRAKGWWNNGVWLLMNQHDALIFEIDEGLVDPVTFIVEMRKQVEFPIEHFPKVVSDWEFGYRWGSCVRVYETTNFERLESGHWSALGATEVIERDDDYYYVEGPPEDEGGLPDEPLVSERGELRPVVIEVSRQPTTTEFHALMRLVSSRPGPYEAVLRTPEGDLTVWRGTSIGVGTSAEVSLALPGASVYHPDDRGIDVTQVMEALT
jgi:DNA polymerase-1